MVDITDLINNVTDQDFANAGPTFAEIMKSKMDDALEQEKISLADQIFNGVDPEEEEELEEEGSKGGEYKRRGKSAEHPEGHRAGDVDGHYKAYEKNEELVQEVLKRVRTRLAAMSKK